MKRFKIYILLCLVTLFPKVITGQNAPPEIVAVGSQEYCSGTTVPIATSVSISDPDMGDTTLNTVVIQISEGYLSGQDILSITSPQPNISASWLPAQGQLVLEGPATFSEFEDAILDVVFSTTQINFFSDRSFSINLGNANFLPSTGHYYFYVADVGISWPNARDAAAIQTFFGLQGYLATLTTAEEAQLAGEQSSGTGWIGASDEANEGTWLWVTGPEAGTPFWQGQVSGTPINGEFSFWNNGEPNNLGDEDYAHITDPSIGLLGSWNDLEPNGNPDPSNPFHPQGYIVEFGGLPGDPTINLSASTTITMPQSMAQDQAICEGEQATLTVTTNTDEVLWYETQTSTTVLNTGDTYTISPITTTTYWVNARFAGCTTDNRIPITVSVNPLPVTNDISIEQCNDVSSPDGISVFRLNNFIQQITNGATGVIVTFFEDNALTQQIDPNNYTNLSNGQIIYARVLNPNTSCEQVAEVTLNVSQFSDESFSLEVCDDDNEDGFTEFMLNQLDADVLIGFPSTSQTAFYQSFEDALFGQNQLASNYTNQVVNSETIFVKVTDGNNCLGIFEVLLVVNPLPQLEDDETFIYCLNTFPATITLSGGIINDIPNNYYYNWLETDETTIEIQVNEPGTFTVEVTEVDGCTNTRVITVLPSNTATVASIDIFDASENNTITVNLTPDSVGDYEYALDFENGPYQDSNTFENVLPGIRTVYIRDKNGCGIVQQEFAVIGFPKFFTPNGDGQNDFWSIKGFDEEFLNNATVQIFNRHGKLLTELSASTRFWDGMYNGNLMPTDDYWFTVILQDGRSFSKHFTLKR